MVAVPWCAEAAEGLRRALGADLEAVAAQVQAGEAMLWRVEDHTWIVTRIEREIESGRRELVTVAIEGRELHPLCRHLIACVRRAGLDGIRLHTVRPGLPRYLARYGIKKVGQRGPEQIYRWERRDGRKIVQ